MIPKEKRGKKVIALLLCTAFLLGGPVRPLHVYANLDPALFDDGTSSAASSTASSAASSAAEAKPATEVKKTNPQDKYQAQIDKINDKLEDLTAEKKEIEKSINEAKTAKEKELATKNYINQQISVTQGEIGLLLDRISLLEESIVQKEEDIALKQADIDLKYEQFKKRLRALQLSDDATTLGLVLGASDFADFLSKTETVTSIAEHDRALMRELTNQRLGLEADKKSLEADKAQILADKDQTEQRKQTLNVQLNAAAVAAYNFEMMEKEYLADLQKNQAQTKAMESELDSIYKQIEWDKNPYIGGVMAWPVPGYTKISSPYGPRFGGKDFHTGMDIAGTGIHGKTIVAANAGTVKFVNWSYSPGRGYGIYLIIDHGGGTTTLYGHCSNILVSVGDQVAKGQAVAQVGSTGWSTGPHLHFEVRLNGTHTNPYPYVTGG